MDYENLWICSVLALAAFAVALPPFGALIDERFLPHAVPICSFCEGYSFATGALGAMLLFFVIQVAATGKVFGNIRKAGCERRLKTTGE